MKIAGIYKITSPSGGIYIGQSVDINKRKSRYKNCKCNKQNRIFRSLIKYGYENHTFEIIHVLDITSLSKKEIVEELNLLEIYYIESLNSFSGNNPNGLNLTKGGVVNVNSYCDETLDKIKKSWTPERLKRHGDIRRGIKQSEEWIRNATEARKATNYIPSKETREKMSKAKIGVFDGEKNPNYGKKASPETIEKIRIAALNRNTENHPMLGKKHSNETKKKQSEAKKGLYNGENNPNYGKKASPETIKKRTESRRIIRQERLTMIF